MYVTVLRVHENKDKVAIFIYQLNVLCRLAQFSYTQKSKLIPTVLTLSDPYLNFYICIDYYIYTYIHPF